MREDDGYLGVRVRLVATLGKARLKMVGLRALLSILLWKTVKARRPSSFGC
jgi:hypothetical protein